MCFPTLVQKLLFAGWLFVSNTYSVAQSGIPQVIVPIDLLKKHVYFLASDRVGNMIRSTTPINITTALITIISVGREFRSCFL